MTNEHNPIALRVHAIQQLWHERRASQVNALLIRLMVHSDDIPLINGFLKLESSPHATIEEMPVIMLTDFESEHTFSYQLIDEFLQTYATGVEEFDLLAWTQFKEFQELHKVLNKENIDASNQLLATMLSSFYTSTSGFTRLLLGIHPRKVYSHKGLNKWCMSILPLLQEPISLLLIDHKGKDYHQTVFENDQWKTNSQTIVVPNQDMASAYEELMTQGSPNDPQVAFRKCMLEMGKAAKAKQLTQIHKWGEKALEISQATGDKSFWASAHLVYAGFLFTLKDTDTITGLLNHGIKVAKTEDNQALKSVLLQLYGYKASYFCVIEKHQDAIEWFLKQARTAINYQELLVAITAYKTALIWIDRHGSKTELKQIVAEAFEHGYTLEDELLKATEFALIASYYIDEVLIDSPDKEREIEERMQLLYGMHWKDFIGKNHVAPQTQTEVTQN